MSSTGKKEVHNLGYGDIALAANNMVAQIVMDGFKPHMILGIHRGGIIPAAMVMSALARTGSLVLLDYHMSSILASSYKGQDQTGRMAIDIPEYVENMLNSASRNVLIIDDIFDTGKTMSAMLHELQTRAPYVNFRTAALYTKKPSGTNYFGHMIEPKQRDHWLHFPWEL